MASQARRRALPSSRFLALLTVLVTALLVVGVAPTGVAPARAEDGTFNPFDANRGFTVVAQGDVVLGNGELEGSIAALGSLSSSRGNYPIRHRASGLADYTVPHIDQEPVRVLADAFTGTGNIDLTNDQAPAGSPEARAIAKFAVTEGVSAGARGGHEGFTRLRNADSTHEGEGYLDLKALPFASFTTDRVQAQRASVADYFDLDADITRANQCFAAMYDADPAVVNMVDFRTQGDLMFVTEFADDRPNVFFYDDLVYEGWDSRAYPRTIKLEGAARNYVPHAQAPLVIKARPGTTQLGRINVEGWSAGANQHQSYARHILLDLSEVTGAVTIDELELGAIWAPAADLVFNSGVSTNGMWLARNVTTSGGGEIHHHDFGGRLPCPAPAPDPTGSLSLTKVVTGDGAELAADHSFSFEVTIDGHSHVVSLADGESHLFADLPLGTEVSVVELATTAPEGTVLAGVDYRLDGAAVDGVDLAIESEAPRDVVVTNTFDLEPEDPVLTLVKHAPQGDPADWTLTATDQDGTAVVTGEGTASGQVTAGATYTLSESGGPAEFVQDGDWQCVAEHDDGSLADVATDAGDVVVPSGTHVTCTVTNVTATLTVLKHVTGQSGLLPSDWTLSVSPQAGVDGLGAVTVPGASAPADDNTVLVRPEHEYALTEQAADAGTAPSLQLAVERYVGPTPDAPDHSVAEHWQAAPDPAAISVDRTGHQVYRIVNFVPTPLELPVLGGTGTSTLLMAGGAVMAAGLVVGLLGLRRRHLTAPGEG